jgi:hypothetical protein
VREESHLDDMRAAIRGDFERLARRRGAQELMQEPVEAELEPEPPAEPERAPSAEPEHEEQAPEAHEGTPSPDVPEREPERVEAVAGETGPQEEKPDEASPAEAGPAESTAESGTAEAPSEEPETEAEPRRRGFFARLLGL